LIDVETGLRLTYRRKMNRRIMSKRVPAPITMNVSTALPILDEDASTHASGFIEAPNPAPVCGLPHARLYRRADGLAASAGSLHKRPVRPWHTLAGG
jgi:hypothetical protein